MILTYNFVLPCEVQQPAKWQDLEPRYKQELCDIEYNYQVTITRKDLEAYFQQTINDELFEFIDIERLEDDEQFIDFMMPRYESRARAQAKEEHS